MRHDKDETEAKEDDGLLYLFGHVETGTAEALCERIIDANVEGKLPHLQLLVNSTGGALDAGFAIVDMMEWSRIPIYTTGVGMIASMGLLIFMAGEKGRRVITHRTSILSHRYSSLAMGTHSDLVANRKQQDLTHCRVVNHYIQHTKIESEDELNQTLLRDTDVWLTPAEAIELGICDQIQEDRRHPYPNIQTRDLKLALEVEAECK